MSKSGNNASADEQAILKIAREMFAEIREKDTAALGRRLADDFVHRGPDGEASKHEFLEDFNAMPFAILSVRGHDLRVKLLGDVAVLTGVQIARVRLNDGRETDSVVSFADVFVRREGRWLLTLAHGVALPEKPKAGGER